MAMYYENSSEIQGDGLQTLYLMNPNYAAYSVSDSDTQHNMQFFNSAALLPHAPPPPQFVGIPPLSHDHDREQQQDIPAAQNMTTARHHYNMWGSLDNQPNTTPPRGLSLSLSGHHQAAISGGVISPKQRSPLATEWNGVIMGSKYLKSAQELLDEVVNVGNHLPDKVTKPIKDYSNREPPQTANKAAATATATATDLTTATRQEIQMKKTKLNIMLDEVEQRCKQYHHEMQMIIAAFEQVAGTGSARSYTQLPLKTILKQFRCLKSTISAQIKALNKSLGEEESLDNNFEGSRLKFVDHDQVRQQRTMQQLGMMHNNAWRPQRGLPERAVSVLRAWLFQHFLHPYPKDSDKQMLAKQTGLTRSQVSNWFINARVRLWKPMVEEMYLEETKNQQQQNASTKPEPEPEPDTKTTTPTVEMISPPAPSVPSRTNFAQLISSLNMENLSEKNPKKARNEELSSSEKYVSMGGAMANMNSRYGMGELDQQLAAGFGHGHGQGQGNSFCLSLALPPTVTADTSFLSHTHTHTHTHRSFENINIESEGGGAYEMLHFQNRKQPFPPQLLPDFVT